MIVYELTKGSLDRDSILKLNILWGNIQVLCSDAFFILENSSIDSKGNNQADSQDDSQDNSQGDSQDGGMGITLGVAPKRKLVIVSDNDSNKANEIGKLVYNVNCKSVNTHQQIPINCDFVVAIRSKHNQHDALHIITLKNRIICAFANKVYIKIYDPQYMYTVISDSGKQNNKYLIITNRDTGEINWAGYINEEPVNLSIPKSLQWVDSEDSCWLWTSDNYRLPMKQEVLIAPVKECSLYKIIKEEMQCLQR